MKYCPNCGTEAKEMRYCSSCGTSLQAGNSQGYQPQPKSQVIAFILCFFLGGLGAHRFYVGKIGTGIFILLFNVPSIAIFSFTSTAREFYGGRLSEIGSNLETISAVLAVFFTIWILIDLIRIITGSFIEDSNPKQVNSGNGEPIRTKDDNPKQVNSGKFEVDTSCLTGKRAAIILAAITLAAIIFGVWSYYKEKKAKAVAEANAAAALEALQKADSIEQAVVRNVKISKTSFIDPRDNKKYKANTIGNQTWMAENLNYNTGGGKCYDNKITNCNKYGRLYNWKSAMMACPKGWHLPSAAEWDVLTATIGGVKTGGKYLKATSGWNNYGNGKDKFDFSALPGGSGYSSGNNFSNVGNYGYWWSASEINANNAYGRYMSYNDEGVDWNSNSKDGFRSVRCVKD